MSALHWICALTLALMCCLSAQPVKRNAALKDDILQDLKLLKNIAENKCRNDTELYSPSDFSEDCLPSALNCTIGELTTLAKECKNEVDNEEFQVFDNVITELSREDWKKVSPSPSQSSSPNCICENPRNQRDIKTFLNNIESLVQRL